MAGDLDPIPGRQIGADLAGQALEALAVEGELLRQVVGGLLSVTTQQFTTSTKVGVLFFVNFVGRFLPLSPGW